MKLKFENNLAIFNYQAKLGPGIYFPVKSYLVKGVYDQKERLWIISPGNFPPDLIEEINAIDEKPFLVAPNGFHYLHIEKMLKVFPESKAFGPKRAMEKSKQTLLNPKEMPLPAGLEVYPLEGHKLLSETVFYHKETKNILATDLFFNMHHQMEFGTKFMLKCAGAYHKTAQSRLLKTTVTDKELFHKSMTNILNFDFSLIRVSHGAPISKEEYKNLLISEGIL